MCALVASDGQASLRRSISETDLLVSEEEVNQTFACWKEDLVGTTGLWLLANVRDHGWDTGQYLSEVLGGRPAKRAGRCSLGHALHCLAPHWVVSETCVLFALNGFWATLSGRLATVSTVLVSQRAPSAGLLWLLRTPSILRVLRRVAL